MALSLCAGVDGCVQSVTKAACPAAFTAKQRRLWQDTVLCLIGGRSAQARVRIYTVSLLPASCSVFAVTLRAFAACPH